MRETLRLSFDLLRNNFSTFFPYVLLISSMGIIEAFLEKSMGDLTLTSFIVKIIFTILSMGCIVLCLNKILAFIEDRDQSFKMILDKSIWDTPSFILSSLLLSMTVVFGFFLLIIPAFIFLTLYGLAPIISVLYPNEKSYFKVSKEIIHGRYFLFFCINLFPALLGGTLIVLSLYFKSSPLFFLFYLLLGFIEGFLSFWFLIFLIKLIKRSRSNPKTLRLA